MKTACSVRRQASARAAGRDAALYLALVENRLS